MKKKTTKIPFTTESVNDQKNTIDFVMSTDDIDREGEIVEQNWDLEAFKDNPVVLNSHNYDDASEAIGKVVELDQKDNSLEGKVKFAVDENPKAETIYELYKGGFLNAVSVGFRELSNGIKELLELSSVTVPANAMATAKSKGIDVEPLEEEQKEKIMDVAAIRVLSQARGPEYDGTETSSWGDVSKTMDNYLENAPGDTEDVEEVGEMTAEQKNWIASKSLLGDPDADTFDELLYFPVVNPNTNDLNKGALEAVRGGRGQAADIPNDAYNSADQKAKNLLEEEFDVEYEEESKEIKAGRVLSSANRQKVQNAVDALRGVLEADAQSREAQEEDVEEKQEEEREEKQEDDESNEKKKAKEALNELHEEVEEENNKRKLHKAIRDISKDL